MNNLLPVNISFEDWVCELRNSYPDEDIPYFVSSEKDWRLLSNMLSSNRCFDDIYLPRVEGFSNWRDWAARFIQVIGA